MAIEGYFASDANATSQCMMHSKRILCPWMAGFQLVKSWCLSSGGDLIWLRITFLTSSALYNWQGVFPTTVSTVISHASNGSGDLGYCTARRETGTISGKASAWEFHGEPNVLDKIPASGSQ